MNQMVGVGRPQAVPRRALGLALVWAVSVSCGNAPSSEVADPPAYRPTAATAPSTDIYLGVLTTDEEGLAVTGLTNATNRDGYDNQPAFSLDGTSLFYTSARDTTQTDIYRLDVRSGTHHRMTDTENASEFSATVTPDGLGISTIHEDATSQQLWHFEMDGTSKGGLFGDMQPVGYHAWLDEQTVLAFVLGNDSTPPTLQVASLSGKREVLLENPGRSLHRVPGTSDVSFVHKTSDSEWLIKTVNPALDRMVTLTATLPEREDYAWLPDGSIVMGRDAILFRWLPGEEWTELADLTEYGVQGISRLAVSTDGTRIAVVGTRTAPQAP